MRKPPSLMRHTPTASKFSSENPIGSTIAGVAREQERIAKRKLGLFPVVV